MLYNTKNNTYCCFGVLGHVCGIDNKKMSNIGFFGWDYISEKEIKKLPKEIFEIKNGIDFADRLIPFNDGIKDNRINAKGKKYTFNEIADIIDKKF